MRGGAREKEGEREEAAGPGLCSLVFHLFENRRKQLEQWEHLLLLRVAYTGVIVFSVLGVK